MAKIGCLKPFRGSYNNLANVVLEDGEIAFDTTNKRIYMGNGSTAISSLTPYINNGNTDISSIGDGSITGAINTINSMSGGNWTTVYKTSSILAKCTGIWTMITFNEHAVTLSDRWDNVGHVTDWGLMPPISDVWIHINDGKQNGILYFVSNSAGNVGLCNTTRTSVLVSEHLNATVVYPNLPYSTT